MALQMESFPTIVLLMKSFMKNEVVPTIPHLIQEVPDLKKFIADWILDGKESLMGHTKVHQFKFYVDSIGTPVLKYKIYYHDEEWLSKGEGNGIKLWKEDSEGRSLWLCGVPDAVKPETMCHLPEVMKGLSGFIDHWEQSSEKSIESRRLNEPLSYYWRDVRDALSLPMDTPISLQNGFWPSTPLHMPWKMSLQKGVMFAKSMVKIIISLDIGVIVHLLHFELAVIFMLVVLLH